MRCYVIDPHLKEVREETFEWDGEDYTALNKNIYRLGKFGCYDCLRIDKGDRIYVDDMGLYAKPPLPGWTWVGYSSALCGIGVVLGSRGEDTIDPRTTLSFIQKNVEWL